ncbi:bis(5'-nucleosyl)-tetraphosphatase (symmetrical) YqeK [Sporosarcina sp. FSL K6-1540]|uniref:bis(5'-nucleosyl)-tetraphosphatase (symmetrical) YqeK n=1 Tax=Sporosarcina TaxID=1569 RepID=UPI00078DD835|nr:MULTISPECIES: bis(5'-nucleosyl)-tetraphosphatase (symmetrical) YqeK [Sporosarcina]AMQ06057.1 phosphohydrolase [Sporosarcina psychrophila]QNK90022.1 bis(5'-nucleosyl)-tetraphosphatase (symmetrical) YqeK [Sporosarcina sp. resist]
MEVAQLKIEIAKRMPKQRYEHVLRVTETAKRLAEKYRLPVIKAEQAALFHDIAKFMDKADLHHVLNTANEDSRLLSFHHELWHAPVGAIIARDEFGISDADILNAIRYHTTGRATMSPLEKLIYVSDMIEPGRSFPGVDELRVKAEENLDTAMEACIYQSVQFLVNKRVPVFPDSIDCYNQLIRREQ